MPGTYVKKSTGWQEILSIYVKKSTGWIEILNAYVKKSTGWEKIFTRSSIPGILTTPKVRDIFDNNIDNDLVISNVGDTLVGYRGTWANSPTSYEYRWMYSTIAGGTLTPFSPAQSGTFSGTTTNLVTTVSWDDRYVYLQVRATNAFGTSDWVTSSNYAHLIKYAPFIYDAKIFRAGTEVTTSTVVSSGQTLTGQFSEITDADQISDSYVYEWLYSDNTTAANSDGTATYRTDLDDVGKSLKFKVTGSNSGGESSAESILTSAIVEGYPGYSFSMGKVLYVGTNGYIGLTNGSTVYNTIPSNGTFILIQREDLQVNDIRYWSDGTKYVVTVDAYKLGNVGAAAYRVKYQAAFYTNQAYMDYRIINFGSSMVTMSFFGLYYNGVLVGSAYPGPFTYGANATMRIPYDGSAPTAYVAAPNIPDAAAVVMSTTPTVGSADDGYYSITTAANQYALPFNTLNTPSATSDSISATSSASGNNYTYMTYTVRTGSHSGTFVKSENLTGTTLSITGLSSGVRYYVTVIPYNSLDQAGSTYQFDIQTVSNPGAFNITSVTKSKPTGTLSTDTRSITVNWGQSTNATKYEFQIEGSTTGTGSWSALAFDPGDGTGSRTWTLASSPYYDYGTGTKTFLNVPNRAYIRVTMRARGADLNLANSAYSNGGSSTSLVYVDATGTVPDKPTLTTPTGTNLTATSVSIPFTFPTNTGSNFIDWIQFSTDQINWTNDYTSPYVFTTTANTTYTVYARSLNYDGLTSNTPHNSVTFTTPRSLTAPTSLTATTTDSTKIRLNWSGGYGDTYELYYSNATSSTDTTYAKPTNQQAFADFTGITAETYDAFLNQNNRGNYRRFWVRAKVGTSLSNWYPAVTSGILGYMPLYAPGLVGSLTNSAQASGSLSFWWNAPTTSSTADAASSYDYALTQSTATPSSWPNNTTTVPTSSSPLTISSLAASTTYYLHVRAKNADANGSSTYVSGTTKAAAVKPGTPSPTATRKYTSITVSWSATTDTTSYQLQISTSSTFGTTVVDDTAATSGTEKTGLTAGTTYYYRVRAYNADYGYGDYSATGTITTGTVPSFTPSTATNPTFDRNDSLSRLRWGWNNPTVSGDYSSISYQWQFSSTASTTGLITQGTAKPFRTSGTLTVGASSFLNRISSLSGDYNSTTNIASSGTNDDNNAATNAGEPVTYGGTVASGGARYVRYRARVIGLDGTAYTQIYSGWI